jgi:RNA polymerase sigma-70 factor (ECF subfamily)
VYRTVRRRGGSSDEAEDLTQAFFLRVIESRSFTRARLASSCFRPYVVAAVRNFLRNERVREHADKRGGHLVLDGFDESQMPVCASLTSPRSGDPDALLDRTRFEDAWKAALDRALANARDTAERRRIEMLLPHLDGLGRAADCAGLADDLGMTPGAVRVALHRLRRKVGGYLTSAARHGA